jgi:high affinity Mn2+ porin
VVRIYEIGSRNIGVFSRLGWNNGQNEAWMFTDVNHTGSLGVVVKGEAWHRPDDTVGMAGVISGISNSNHLYLGAGGLGILDGDGALNYAGEKVLEAYYDGKISKHLRGALDYQFVADPAFNSARGPVSVFGIRLHFEH